MRAIATDMGLELKIKVKLKTDASATVGVLNRQGQGKLRHVAVNELWLQDNVKSGEVQVIKIPGKDNLADMFTKAVHAERIHQLMNRMGMNIKAESRTEQTQGDLQELGRDENLHIVKLFFQEAGHC